MLEELIPIPDVVEIEGKRFGVGGLTFRNLAVLVSRFPPLAYAFAGKEVQFASVMASSPDVVSAIMAMGLSNGGTTGVTEAQCDILPADIQLDVIARTLGRTFSKGRRPFLDSITKLVNTLNIQIEQEQTTISEEF